MKKMDMKSSQTMELSGESCEHLWDVSSDRSSDWFARK